MLNTKRHQQYKPLVTICKIKDEQKQDKYVLKNIYGTSLWLQFDSRLEAKEWAKTNGYEVINFKNKEE